MRAHHSWTFKVRCRVLVICIVDVVTRGEQLGRRPGRLGYEDVHAVARPVLARGWGLERQLHGTHASQRVEVEQAAVGGGLWDPKSGLLLLATIVVAIALDGQDSVIAADRFRVGAGVFGAAHGLGLVVLLDIRAAGVVGQVVGRAGNDSAVVAREPAANAVDHTVPPSALQLGNDLDDVALAETQARAVVGVVVVELLPVNTGPAARRRALLTARTYMLPGGGTVPVKPPFMVRGAIRRARRGGEKAILNSFEAG